MVERVHEERPAALFAPHVETSTVSLFLSCQVIDFFTLVYSQPILYGPFILGYDSSG